MGRQEKVKVKKLHKSEPWSLFKQKLELDNAVSPEVKIIAESMVNICDGLPLGIIRGESSIHASKNELEKLRDPNMVQDVTEEKVFKVLKLI
ncbi:hypothetical protein CDL12_00215 [Handroanthus impetiginosus]|uniref:NB-ARC domain-containing protein n=1 Tax=Handroanthus impetiginosus TaxID=429701 RepID=A0A2G9IBG9_9LAMI|nr:hypothetical protein CDL12_00215 [Handroanthus impetiginosus]